MNTRVYDFLSLNIIFDADELKTTNITCWLSKKVKSNNNDREDWYSI